MAEGTGTSRTAIVTAIVALIGAVASAVFSAYSTITVATEKHSVERAALFRDLIEQLAVEQASSPTADSQPARSQVVRAKLALLNLWQLYPDEHKIIVLAALEIGQNELVETMIRLDEELRPHSELLLTHARSSNRGIGDAATRVLQEVDPLSAARIHVDDLVQQDRPNSLNLTRNNQINTLIELSGSAADVEDYIDERATENPVHEPLLRYILYRGARDKRLLPLLLSRLDSERADDVTAILCCGQFHAEDQRELVASMLELASGDRSAKPFLVSWAANFLANPSLEIGGLSGVVGDVTTFCRDVVEDATLYSQARANALRALSVWNPPEAMMLAAGRLAADEQDERVRLEIEQLLQDPGFVTPALQALGVEGGGVEGLPAAEDMAEEWDTWLNDIASR